MVKIQDIPLEKLTSQKALLEIAKKLKTAETENKTVKIFIGMSPLSAVRPLEVAV